MKKEFKKGDKVHVIDFKDGKWKYSHSMTIDEIVYLKTNETFYVEYYENYEDSSTIFNAYNCFSTKAKAIKECNERNQSYRVLFGD